MTTEAETSRVAQAGTAPRRLLARVPWAAILLLALAALLAADRWRYLHTFGFVYTDGDQVTFWYQAWEVSHGIFREPCLYGQAYNVAVEAWLGAVLMGVGVPAQFALPTVTVALALLPFILLAALAYRRGMRWGASMILLIPLALPVEYLVVSSLPRGFVNGIAVAAIGAALWIFGRGKWAFFFGGLFAVAGLGVNPSCAILLLAAGLFALLTHWRSGRFYLFSAAGALGGALVPLGVWIFYHWHPECDVYDPKVGNRFTWALLTRSLQTPKVLDMFWSDLAPILHRGWGVLAIFGFLVTALLALRKWREAAAVLAAALMTVLVLGSDRIHSSWSNVFYSGTRMFLAVPVVWAMALWWINAGLSAWVSKRGRALAVVLRTVIILGLAACALGRHVELLKTPSPFVTEAYLPPVEPVAELQRQATAIAAACKEYHATLVLIPPGSVTGLGEAGPELSSGAFETLTPWFERRSFRVAEERVKKHTAVLLFSPGFKEMLFTAKFFPGSRIVARSPNLLLITLPGEGKTGIDIAEALGMTVRLKI